MSLEVYNEDEDISTGAGSVSADIHSKKVCDKVEVDINGVPTPGAGYYRNFPVTLKYTQDALGIETKIGYFDVYGNLYTEKGTIQDCPAMLCCEDWEDMKADRRLVALTPDTIGYLTDATSQFGLGLKNIKWLISAYEVGGTISPNLNATNQMTPSNANYYNQLADTVTVGTPTTGGAGTNNFKNFIDFLNFNNTFPEIEFNMYNDSNIGNGHASFSIDIPSASNFRLKISSIDPDFYTIINSYEYIYDASTDTFTYKIYNSAGVSIGAGYIVALNNFGNYNALYAI